MGCNVLNVNERFVSRLQHRIRRWGTTVFVLYNGGPRVTRVNSQCISTRLLML